jgi:hypothetical protein
VESRRILKVIACIIGNCLADVQCNRSFFNVIFNGVRMRLLEMNSVLRDNYSSVALKTMHRLHELQAKDSIELLIIRVIFFFKLPANPSYV